MILNPKNSRNIYRKARIFPKIEYSLTYSVFSVCLLTNISHIQSAHVSKREGFIIRSLRYTVFISRRTYRRIFISALLCNYSLFTDQLNKYRWVVATVRLWLNLVMLIEVLIKQNYSVHPKCEVFAEPITFLFSFNVFQHSRWGSW